MLVPLSWLQKYVKIDLPPKEIAQMLTMAGIEVNEFKVIGGHLDEKQFIVGKVVRIEPHPNADRILLPVVDLGSDNEVQVVCGAPNLLEGQKIAFAKSGAKVFNTRSQKVEQLREANIRGFQSHGMICSIKELGLGDDHEGIMVLEDSAEIGTPLINIVGDVVFDIDITPNRPDCLSIQGIAREIAVLTNKTIMDPDLNFTTTKKVAKPAISVEVKDPELCPRYTATVIEGVKIKTSPAWLRNLLIRAGQRPINNVVDVTNYVMMELNQPLHAFDISSIKDRSIIVRQAKSKEKITTLDGEERTLEPPMLVIADTSGPVGLAGIMGGLSSEVNKDTSMILLEAANFDPINIRRTSSKLHLSTGASYRFERTLSPKLAEIGLRRATELIRQLSGGEIHDGIIDVTSGSMESKLIPLHRHRLIQVLGTQTSFEQSTNVLKSLGFVQANPDDTILNIIDTIEPSPASQNDTAYFAVPYWRPEIEIEEDLIEEIARILGYDTIPTTMLSTPIPHHHAKGLWHYKEQIKDMVATLGMREIITYNLNSEQELIDTKSWDINNPPLALVNPMIFDQRFLRPSLVPNMLKTLSMNRKTKRDEPLKLFELGRIFIPSNTDSSTELPLENESLIGAFCGNRNAKNWTAKPIQMDFYDAKGVLESLLNKIGLKIEFKKCQNVLFSKGRRASVVYEKQIIGDIGEVDTSTLDSFDLKNTVVTLFIIDIKLLLNIVENVDRTYKEFSKYPDSTRDVALIVDKNVLVDQIQSIFKQHKYVKDIFPFDIYTDPSLGINKKSVAFQIVFQSTKNTLTAEQIDRCMQDLLNKLQRSVEVDIRQG